MIVEARRSILPDIAPIAASMRPEDRAEVLAASGDSPINALRYGYLYCDECFTVVTQEGREPLAMFGYRVVEKDVGAVVWLLASTRLLDYRWSFLRQSRQWMDYFQTKAPLLYNAVDQRNTVHIRWLDWLGFKFIRVLPSFGKQQLPFIEFARLRNV